MTEQPHCPKCGSQLPADAPAGLCPKCLVQAGLESEPGPHPRPAATVSSAAFSGFEPLSVESLAGKFPQLEILELLGKGGMGAVYKARQRGLDRLVAVKVLPPEIGHDAAFAERFTREAKALARLSHNHIVSVFDFGQSDGLYYIVMEYVDGVNLRQTMQAGKLTPAEALAIVPQICEALQFAHDEGIVHRDIKPENILIDKRGRVKIADFGLAKLVASGGRESTDASLTATHQVMGTLRYMAPEQMLGTREVDHRADIYSLGVIFYELLTGELPMGKFAPPSKKVQIDVRLDEIVLRALEQHPEQRYQHASDVKSDMEAISRSPTGLLATLGHARDEWWAARGMKPPKPATDGLVFLRLSVFNLLFWLIWSALLAGLHWGYVTGANWYFKQELPYSYLSGAWLWISLMFAFFSGYWWYLLAKSPETPRSLADSWRTLQTPDRRAIRVWIPAGTYLAIWGIATMLTMTFANDDVQSTTLTALFIAAPLVAGGSCCWAFRERAGELLRDQGPPAEQSLSITSEPRFSRFAILGAVWALLGVLTIIPILFFIGLSRVWNGTSLPTDVIYEQPPLVFTIFMGALLAIGAGAPIGTTIFGAIAIGHIKRSGGKVIGLPLAVADALFFPLLLLAAAAGLAGTFLILVMIPLGIDGYVLSKEDPPYLAILAVAASLWFFPARALWRFVVGPGDAFKLPKIPLVGTESLVGKASLVIALAAIATHAWPWEWIIMPNNHSVTISNFDDIRTMQSLLALALAIAAALFAAAPGLTLLVKRIVRGLAVIGGLAALVLQIQFFRSLGEFEPGGTVVRLTRSYPQMGLYAAIALTTLMILFFVLRLAEERTDASRPANINSTS